jgi:DNA-binding SARP family transcriptional activator
MNRSFAFFEPAALTVVVDSQYFTDDAECDVDRFTATDIETDRRRNPFEFGFGQLAPFVSDDFFAYFVKALTRTHESEIRDFRIEQRDEGETVF